MKKNKKIFITGASGGIGSSICDKFLENNFTLLLTSSSSDKLERLKEKYGDNHFYYEVDLSNEDNLQKCLDQVSKDHKDISVVVNNAGVTEDGLIMRMNYEQWSKVIQTNLSSNYQIIKIFDLLWYNVKLINF